MNFHQQMEHCMNGVITNFYPSAVVSNPVCHGNRDFPLPNVIDPLTQLNISVGANPNNGYQGNQHFQGHHPYRVDANGRKNGC